MVIVLRRDGAAAVLTYFTWFQAGNVDVGLSLRADGLTAIMLVMSEPGNKAGLSADENAEEMRRVRIEYSMLPERKFPRLIECAVPMTSCDDPEFHYRMGIDLFIAGVEALAAGQQGQESQQRQPERGTTRPDS